MKNIIAVVSVFVLVLANYIISLVEVGIYESSRLFQFVFWAMLSSFVISGIDILTYYIFYHILNRILKLAQGKGGIAWLALIEAVGFCIIKLIINLLPEFGTVPDIVIANFSDVLLMLAMLSIVRKKYDVDFKGLTKNQKIKFGVWIAAKLILI